MVLGVLLGLVPIPVPGVGTVTLGIGGGPLIVALIVGRLRRTGPISWVMPLPANIVLRNFGLTLFLATVGINSGQAFVDDRRADRAAAAADRRGGPADHGRSSSCWSATTCCGSRSTTCWASPRARPATRPSWSMPTRMAPTERPDIGYAMIFPSATIVKVVAVQIIGLIVLGGG